MNHAEEQPADATRTVSHSDRRVLNVISSTDRRGAELFGVQLHESLTARNWQSEVVALWPGKAKPALALTALGSRRNDPRSARKLRRLASDGGIVIGHGSSSLPFGAIATYRNSGAFVYRSIGDPRFWGSSRVRRTRVGLALRRAQAIVALWPGAADFIADTYGVDRSRVYVIPTGVETENFHPTSPDQRISARMAYGGAIDPTRPTVVYVGSLSAEKNPMAAVDAVAGLPDVQLIMAGTGPMVSQVAQRARSVAAGRVHLLGSVTDPRPIYAMADVVLIPSRTEGIPAVAIEAALSGLPVVASRVGGLVDVVVDDQTGYLIDELTPESVARTLDRALMEGGSMGTVARERAVGRFELEHVVNQWTTMLATIALT